MSLADYLSAAAAAVSRQDGATLAQLLSLEAEKPRAAVAAAVAARSDLGALASARLPPPFDEIVGLHCRVLALLAAGKQDEAYGAACGCLSAFGRDFRASDSAWGVPVLARLVKNLCKTAEAADAAALAAGRKPEKLRDAGPQLMAVFPATFGASLREKKLATLTVVNAAFRLYFRLNTLRLCKNMIMSVESRAGLPLSDYSVAQQVAYRFYTGRLAVFDENYAKAEADLSFAFSHCLASSAHNRALILRYLLPVKLLLGQLPADSLFAEFPQLACYRPLVRAVRCGDVRSLNEALEAHQEAFIRQGTYLLVEKLRSGVYRTLLKRVQAVHREREPGKAFQLPIQLFQRALAWLGVQMELDECECVLANLIFRKFIRGYLSHKMRVLVLSKSGAFPPLASVADE